MAESTLSVTFAQLKESVGRYLGHGGPDEWTAEQDAVIELYVKSGVRQFYYPPAVEGVEAGYPWSFLSPKTTIDTVADDAEQDLPDDFGRMLGPMHHDVDDHASAVQIVSQPQIYDLLSGSDNTGTPIYAAVRDKTSTGATGQRKEIVWFPIPDAVYTLTYQYEAFQGILDDDYPYVLGGMKHSELVIKSCLAVAELRANDERGIHNDDFARQLAAAIAQDRKTGAQYYGSMAGPDSSHLASARSLRQGDVTYDGNTW